MGTDQFKRNFFTEAIGGDQAEHARALAPVDDTEVSFKILRLTAGF